MVYLDNMLIAADAILTYFRDAPQKAYTDYSLRKTVNEIRSSWGFSKSTKTKAILRFLLEKGIFQKKSIKGGDGSVKQIYIVPGFDNLTLFTALKKNAYFTHFTAMHLNGLTQQIPKTHYLNHEHSISFDKGNLDQQSIDNAFDKPQRVSTTSYSIGGNKVFLINGKQARRIGVISRNSENQSFDFTDMERTLIDIAIRPAYSGGVFEVLNAYMAAKNSLDVSKLKGYYDELDYAYPYHQVIGFYLDKAGYGNSVTDHFRYDIKHNFYLTYNIQKKVFDENWKLYYPLGF